MASAIRAARNGRAAGESAEVDEVEVESGPKSQKSSQEGSKWPSAGRSGLSFWSFWSFSVILSYVCVLAIVTYIAPVGSHGKTVKPYNHGPDDVYDGSNSILILIIK